MGKFDFNIPPDFLSQLGRLAEVEKAAPKMLDAASPILQRAVKDTLSGHKQSGDMVNSIKKTKAKKKKNGGYVATVRPSGVDKNGVRNMEKAAYWEYGTSKLQPDPWVDKSLNDAESEVLQQMQQTFREEMQT